MLKNVLTILMSVLAVVTGLYPAMYFLVDRKFGLLSSKADDLLANTLWNTGFYVHIIFGGVALLIGWMQFISKIRSRNIKIHRVVGKVYVGSALLSALAGFYIAFFASGGIIASAGFICLAVIWFSTTLSAYLKIRKGQVEQHQKMMIYSYAACFAAVTLRIWLPLLMFVFGEFETAYRIVAWLCWVPNLLVAYLVIQRLERFNGLKV